MESTGPPHGGESVNLADLAAQRHSEVPKVAPTIIRRACHGGSARLEPGVRVRKHVRRELAGRRACARFATGGRGTRKAGDGGQRAVKPARHVVGPAVKTVRLDGSTEGDDGIVGKRARRAIRLDGKSSPLAVPVEIVDGREDIVDRRAFRAALLVFPAAVLTLRSTVLVFRSTSTALPSTVHAVTADRPAIKAPVSALPARLPAWIDALLALRSNRLALRSSPSFLTSAPSS
jgi:hypothetical protein